MANILVFLHTVTALASVFDDLAQEILPTDVDVMHIADEVLLKNVLRLGGLSPFIYRRVAEHASAAEHVGADLMVLTCSSAAPAVYVAQKMVNIPVLRIDEAMADEAVALGTRIGVAATAPTTIKPTVDLAQARAQVADKHVQVDSVLCESAYQALFAGDMQMHDRIVRDALIDLMARCDVVMLAQASMARVADTIPPEERAAPILSSPRTGVERARDVLLGKSH
jgi:Asp/Glu/hydantoin racemase